MILVLAAAALGEWLSIVLAGGALMGGIGYAAGQFMSSRRRALSDSLATALNEVTAYKNKTDRLESDLADMQVQLVELQTANTLLRESIATGAHLAPIIAAEMEAVRVSIEATAKKEHAKTREEIRLQEQATRVFMKEGK